MVKKKNKENYKNKRNYWKLILIIVLIIVTILLVCIIVKQYYYRPKVLQSPAGATTCVKEYAACRSRTIKDFLPWDLKNYWDAKSICCLTYVRCMGYDDNSVFWNVYCQGNSYVGI